MECVTYYSGFNGLRSRDGDSDTPFSALWFQVILERYAFIFNTRDDDEENNTVYNHWPCNHGSIIAARHGKGREGASE